jgi:hypothetical protein
MIEDIGTCIAVVGSIISVIGNLVNTVLKNHRKAIVLWTVSSFLNSLWFYGFITGWWDGGLGAAAMLGMNIVFFASNVWGLWHVR